MAIQSRIWTRSFAKFKFPIADQFISLKREGTILIDTLSKLSGAGETLGDAVKGVVRFRHRTQPIVCDPAARWRRSFTGQLEKLKDMIIALGVALRRVKADYKYGPSYYGSY